ncbi:MAG: SPOR domain-containing protein [Rubricella sp.]
MRDMASEDSEIAATPVLVTLGRWAGALVSLALVVAIALWSWDLYTRDVSEIPVIRAERGEMRIEPPDPGGREFPNQGLEVNRIVGGAPPATPDDVEVAPAPADPAPEDLPNGAISPGLPRIEAPVPALPGAEGEPAPAQAEPAEEAIALPVDEDASPHAPVVSLAPRARPDGLTTTLAPAGPPAAAPVEVDSVAPGTPLIQLGAWPSETVAILQWDQVISDNGDILSDRQRYIEPVNSGGSTLFRLRAVGFGSRAEAQATCVALAARGVDCIPVVQQ